MINNSHGRYAALAAALIACLTAGGAQALPTQLVIFGDSLADTGNNAALIDAGLFDGAPMGARTVPPVAQAFVPTFPYAGTNRYSNGPVWTDQFASALGLSATNSLARGTNFAFGGARVTGGEVPSLTDQMNQFLRATNNVAPSSFLYVVQGGGNDARDAFATAAAGGDPGPLIGAYALGIKGIVSTLEGSGATDILLADVPDIGVAPSIRAFGPPASALASQLAADMNAALFGELPTLEQPGVRIHLLDLYGLLDDVVQHPGAFSFKDVTNSCASDPACIADPKGTLFWDGVHVTTEGAGVIANAALAAVPEPSSLWWVITGLTLWVIWMRKKPQPAGGG
jgi:outer membrane lipase/esterase